MGSEERGMAGQLTVVQQKVTISALFLGLIKKDNQVMNYTTLVPVSSGNYTQYLKQRGEMCILHHIEV